MTRMGAPQVGQRAASEADGTGRSVPGSPLAAVGVPQELATARELLVPAAVGGDPVVPLLDTIRYSG